ncbi:VWA domain-containing protein [Bryobacter aggregatus]|uniref:VWA domain-containing protein n=1 Tax=Bryobacter aggregatus TaxID=360054 RepID=UPI0004E25840|nr:VWA domain-containing protein [Bryobacter aggregatus]
MSEVLRPQPEGVPGQRPMPSHREKGMAVLISAILMFFTLGTVGLAIDGGLAYLVKGRLIASVDSAALGAARGLNLGDDVATANAAATASATRFFNANFPSGYMGTDPALTTITPTFTLLTTGGVANGILQVDVVGAVTAPTYFMRMFSVPNIRVSATGTATRRTLVMMLILDISGSMGSRNTTVGTIPSTLVSNASSCEAMVYSAIQFLNFFSPYDYIGVTTFSSQAQVVYTPSTNYKKTGSAGAAKAIANQDCTGSTNTTPSLELSYAAIQNVGLKLAMNEIALFTDGVANTVSGAFPLRTQKDTRYSPSPVSAINPPSTNVQLLHSDPNNPYSPTTYYLGTNVTPTLDSPYSTAQTTLKNSGVTPLYGDSRFLPLSAVQYKKYTDLAQGTRDAFGWYLGSASGPYLPRWIQDSGAPTNNFRNCQNNDAASEFAYKCYMMAVPSASTSPATVTGSITVTPSSSGTLYNNGSSSSVGSMTSYSSKYGYRTGFQKTLPNVNVTAIPSGFPTPSSPNTLVSSQIIAYIPDTDQFGNSNRGFKDNWVFEVNSNCAPSGTPVNGGNLCRFRGGDWGSYSSVGEGSNFFQSGPYRNYLRPDFNNPYPVAAMNSTVSAANKIRNDTDYNIRIDTIYLMGNENVVDRDFLQIVANVEQIKPIVFDNGTVSPYSNPYFNPNQQKGLAMATTDGSQLAGLFAQIAASLLRLSR